LEFFLFELNVRNCIVTLACNAGADPTNHLNKEAKAEPVAVRSSLIIARDLD
jgi:hypothetical protein